jgi:protein-L-isoaspartate(D-aspartate) O-methyltransferase
MRDSQRPLRPGGIALAAVASLCAATLGLLCLAAAIPSSAAGSPHEEYERRRDRMVEQIRRMHATTPEAAGGSIDESVLEAMAAVPRHLYVPERVRQRAYANRPLPIGHGQTISQPYIVALMTDLLQIEPDDKVFELGTGSGYQAAVLARLAREVHTMEIIPELAEQAEKNLKEAGAGNVRVYEGDAYYGLPREAPFDAIVVTAAAGHIPPPLVEQLKPGGRMVIPVGSPFLTQQLTLVRKDKGGSVKTEHLLPVSFVPLTGGH